MVPIAVAFNTAGVISLLVGFGLPTLVGLVTKQSLNKGLKAALLLAISGVSGVLTQWLDAINNNVHFAWQAAVLTALATWFVAEGSYMKIWKPSGVSDALQAVGVHDASTSVDPATMGDSVSPASPADPVSPMSPVSPMDQDSTVVTAPMSAVSTPAPTLTPALPARYPPRHSQSSTVSSPVSPNAAVPPVE